ncbi:MAG: HAMP domain-containing histidine kinase [Chitinophagaceae bacterium]|nr:MAG: HAMP domain-containing histidine kinase [Chitinophagaceae bacterium]
MDTEGFNKILTNLLSNAVKYAHTKVEAALLSSTPNERYFTLEICNDGFVIPYEMREKIFDPFFRLKETEKQKGTGIGLALSRSLTQLHKGLLELKPSVNEMNLFSLVMPVHQDAGNIMDNEKSEPHVTDGKNMNDNNQPMINKGISADHTGKEELNLNSPHKQ